MNRIASKIICTLTTCYQRFTEKNRCTCLFEDAFFPNGYFSENPFKLMVYMYLFERD